MKLRGSSTARRRAAVAAAFWPAAGGAATFKGSSSRSSTARCSSRRLPALVRAVTRRAAVGSRVCSAGRTLRSSVVRRSAHHPRRSSFAASARCSFLSSNRHLLAIPFARRVGSPTPRRRRRPAPGTVVSAHVGDRERPARRGRRGRCRPGRREHDLRAGDGHGGRCRHRSRSTVQGQTLTVPLPAGLTLPASLVGQTVTIQLSVARLERRPG